MSLKLIITALLLALTANAVAEDRSTLLTQIRELQNKHQFEVSGLEKIDNAQAVPANGNLEQQVKQVFAGYNHIVSRTPKGKIERIVIISKKEPMADRRMVLPTNQQGQHYTVEAMLTGDGSAWQTLDMIVDTGADMVVLPTSLIGPLGLADSGFKPARLQTANGIAVARIFKLREFRIAGESLEDVQAAFIDDSLLGGNKLLGMSVLGRFQLNIDDSSQTITFTRGSFRR